jgi:hypothetical protein
MGDFPRASLLHTFLQLDKAVDHGYTSGGGDRCSIPFLIYTGVSKQHAWLQRPLYRIDSVNNDLSFFNLTDTYASVSLLSSDPVTYHFKNLDHPLQQVDKTTPTVSKMAITSSASPADAGIPTSLVDLAGSIEGVAHKLALGGDEPVSNLSLRAAKDLFDLGISPSSFSLCAY